MSKSYVKIRTTWILGIPALSSNTKLKLEAQYFNYSSYTCKSYYVQCYIAVNYIFENLKIHNDNLTHETCIDMHFSKPDILFELGYVAVHLINNKNVSIDLQIIIWSLIKRLNKDSMWAKLDIILNGNYV